MEKYRIVSISFSRASMARTADGEVLYGRIPIIYTVGMGAPYNGFDMYVDAILFDEDLRSFRICYKGGGLKIIPMYPDTEVTYEPIKETSVKSKK